MSYWSERRKAQNEIVFRGMNEDSRPAARAVGRSLIEFVCECSSSRCTETISADLDEYEAVRASPITFLLVPGHESKEIETVIAQNRRFAVVQKKGASVEMAEQTNPRA